MRGTTHALFATVLVLYFNINPTMIVFSIIPDIDIESSVFGRIFNRFSKKIRIHLGHRGFTHSLLFLFLFYFYKPAFFGILSHLFLDMLTYSGVKLFWPLDMNFMILGGKFVTGGKKEKVLLLFLFLIAGYLLLKKLSLF